MLREFFCAADRVDRIIAWCGLVVIVANALFSAYIKYAVNAWYTKFYE